MTDRADGPSRPGTARRWGKMKTVRVELGSRSYDIVIAAGLLQQVPALFEQSRIGGRLFLVATTKVYELYGADLRKALENGGFEVTDIFIPDGEKFKNLHTVENIYTYLIAQRADRDSTVLALGGGVTGDMAGFVAATFLRGIDYVQIPTTLLSQVDSSVGGKTGVNHPHGKNMIGVFHQPRLVCVDTETLSTLPQREFRSGVYEIVKYGLIRDAEFFQYLEENLEKLLDRDQEVLETVVSRCCRIKAEVISIDEKDSGLRRILNFGHTFGHALEVVTGYQGVTHGEAVACGMLAAGLLSTRLGHIAPEVNERVARLIRRVGRLPSVREHAVDEILDAMNRDKKRRDDRKVFVLLAGIGETLTREDLDDSLVAGVWEDLFGSSPQPAEAP